MITGTDIALKAGYDDAIACHGTAKHPKCPYSSKDMADAWQRGVERYDREQLDKLREIEEAKEMQEEAEQQNRADDGSWAMVHRDDWMP